jgi:hypothetical protein
MCIRRSRGGVLFLVGQIFAHIGPGCDAAPGGPIKGVSRPEARFLVCFVLVRNGADPCGFGPLRQFCRLGSNKTQLSESKGLAAASDFTNARLFPRLESGNVR